MVLEMHPHALGSTEEGRNQREQEGFMEEVTLELGTEA